MQELLSALAISAFAILVAWYRTGHGISPDGDYYLRAGNGLAVPSPYNRRLLPRLLGPRRATWKIVSLGALLLTGPLVWLYTHSLAAVWLFSFLPMFHLNVRLPVLVDPTAMTLSLGSAVAWLNGQHQAALGLAILSGLCKESAPVFAAVYAWSPWLLLGLALPVLFWRYKRDKPDQQWLKKPFATAKMRRDILDWKRMVLPWGLLPLLVLWADIRLWAGLAVGYAQLLVAQDDSRLYQWASPCALALVPHAPDWIVMSMCLVQPFIVGAHRGT